MLWALLCHIPKIRTWWLGQVIACYTNLGTHQEPYFLNLFSQVCGSGETSREEEHDEEARVEMQKAEGSWSSPSSYSPSPTLYRPMTAGHLLIDLVDVR